VLIFYQTKTTENKDSFYFGLPSVQVSKTA